jgi:hypothetical protein
MKVLIWIGCCGTASFVSMLLADFGIILGGIPMALLYGGAVWLAIKLCEKWDWHKVTKKANEANITVSEYGRHGLPQAFLDKLEELCHTVPYEQVKAQLKACVRSGKITKEQCIILLKEYSTKR